MNAIKDIPKPVRWVLEVVALGLLALYVFDVLMPAVPHLGAALVALWAIKRFVPDSIVGKLWKKFRQSKPAKAPKATAPAAPAPPSPTTAAVVNGGVRPRYHHRPRRP